MRPPRAGRLYWLCQAVGWGGCTAYVLGAYYLTTSDHRLANVASIVITDLIICPAVTHGLRHYMYVHNWMALPTRQLVPRAMAVLVALGLALTTSVAAFLTLTDSQQVGSTGFIGMFVGITWALTGWFTIYYAVHARRRREREALELAVVARDAQLRSLRAQLNPHFLFNSLNSLRHLILSHPERAAGMVTSLADLLRYSLTSDRTEMVSLADEMQVVDDYLELERVRFEERLRIERHIEPDCLRARIPPMLIQCLVDNAIK